MWYGVGRLKYDWNEFLMGFRQPHGMIRTYSGPKPLVSPYGPNYSMHPELSRSPMGAITAVVAIPTMFFAAPIVLVGLNAAIIHDMPEHQQPGAWQMFSSALTGTFGGDYSTLI